MVWNEADCCEYVLLRLAQNTRIDEIRIEGWPALLYARRNNYESLKKLMLEKNADPNTAQMEGEGEEGVDPEKTSNEGEVGGEQQDIVGEEGDFEQKSEWSEIRQLQNYVTEIETGLHRRLTEVKASLAIAKLETSQVRERLGSQVVDLKKKLKISAQSNNRLKWEIAELKTAIGVAKCQKSKLEKSLMCENRLLKEQLQQALLEAKVASASKPQVVPQDEEKCTEHDDVQDPPTEVGRTGQILCDDSQSQQNDENVDQYSMEENLPPKENIESEMFCVDDKLFVSEMSNSELANQFTAQIEDLKNMLSVKTNLVVANAKLKRQLALQKMEQKKKLEEVRAKNRRFEKLVEIIRGKLKESKAKDRESKKILVFASAIVKKYLEFSTGREENGGSVDVKALQSPSPTKDSSSDCHKRLCIDMKVAQRVMLDALESELEREPFKELPKNSATNKDIVFILNGSNQKGSLWEKPLNQTPEDFNIKMPQNFKPSERDIEAVTSSFLVHPAG